ncbi:unnamed protein product [Phytomonas sp. Hart1]|nr:unnamed protein product [Phytomonas sp. Hart1]|eukprot:CCW68932.1 unnamed protein product [Phytomonas sp. isolate Hart1]
MASPRPAVPSLEEFEGPVRELLRGRKDKVSEEELALLANTPGEVLSRIQDQIATSSDKEVVWQSLLRDCKAQAPLPESGMPQSRETRRKSPRNNPEVESEGVPKDERSPSEGLKGEGVVEEDVARHPLACADHSEEREWDDFPISQGGFTKKGEKKRNDIIEDAEEAIAQQTVARTLHAAPQMNPGLLTRTYTPRCPRCGLRFGHPPPLWECPMCLRGEGRRVLVWQPDHDATRCGICQAGIGRWSRHHCRSCGRLICGHCCPARAWIMGLGYEYPVKVCTECANHALSTRNSTSKGNPNKNED